MVPATLLKLFQAAVRPETPRRSVWEVFSFASIVAYKYCYSCSHGVVLASAVTKITSFVTELIHRYSLVCMQCHYGWVQVIEQCPEQPTTYAAYRAMFS